MTWQLEARARQLLPSHMIDGLMRYVERGTRPGDFLYAALCNDFIGAASHADFSNLQFFANYAITFESYMPRGSFGSKALVDAWVEAGGLNGHAAVTTESAR